MRRRGHNQTISIHAPRTGSDHGSVGHGTDRGYFNPRSPHGERRDTKRITKRRNDFNPRSPHGERPSPMGILSGGQHFNPRSPHGERRSTFNVNEEWLHFNPRSPHGERHYLPVEYRGLVNFNPRSPHGERHESSISPSTCHTFQSTLPARGATPPFGYNHINAYISIHAPRTGSDCAK